MTLAVELQLDAAMDDSLPLQACADARVDEQVCASLLEDAGADAVLDVVAAAILEHHGLDSLQLQQPRKGESGRAGADDADLRPVGPHCVSSRTRWKTANALFAAGTPQ